MSTRPDNSMQRTALCAAAVAARYMDMIQRRVVNSSQLELFKFFRTTHNPSIGFRESEAAIWAENTKSTDVLEKHPAGS